MKRIELLLFKSLQTKKQTELKGFEINLKVSKIFLKFCHASFCRNHHDQIFETEIDFMKLFSRER